MEFGFAGHRHQVVLPSTFRSGVVGEVILHRFVSFFFSELLFGVVSLQQLISAEQEIQSARVVIYVRVKRYNSKRILYM